MVRPVPGHCICFTFDIIVIHSLGQDTSLLNGDLLR